MIRLFIGFLLGVFAVVGFFMFAPASLQRTAKATVDVVEHSASAVSAKVTDTKREVCERKFLDETHCYQDKGKTSKQCEQEILHRCG